MPILNFGKNADQLKRLFPDAKMLVFTKDAWQLAGASAVAVNERLTYVLVKQK
jgi:isoleucyl-tRNA synthetase